MDCIYEGARMFYIHQTECIECGLCESICPVDAIRYADEVEPADAIYIDVNIEYFGDEVTGLGSPGGWSDSMPADRDHPLVASAPKNELALTYEKKRKIGTH